MISLGPSIWEDLRIYSAKKRNKIKLVLLGLKSNYNSADRCTPVDFILFPLS
jgi:hypothetical protein